MELRAEAFIDGMMGDNSKASGRRTRCMVLGPSDGLMDAFIGGIMHWMRRRATGCLNDQTGGSMRGTGTMECKMARG